MINQIRPGIFYFHREKFFSGLTEGFYWINFADDFKNKKTFGHFMNFLVFDLRNESKEEF